MTGAYLAAAAYRLPVIVDGFIASVAAPTACRICPAVSGYLVFGHRSEEPGHGVALEALEATPLLALGMRLGEGSGAALAFPLLQAATAMMAEMATFTSAVWRTNSVTLLLLITLAIGLDLLLGDPRSLPHPVVSLAA